MIADGSLIGAGIGLVIGIADFILLGVIGGAMRSRDAGRGAAGRGALETVRVLQLVLFPVAGWFAGPYILG